MGSLSLALLFAAAVPASAATPRGPSNRDAVSIPAYSPPSMPVFTPRPPLTPGERPSYANHSTPLVTPAVSTIYWGTSPASRITSSESDCIPPDEDRPPTTIIITHTATTTFYGDPSNYTAPYPTLSTRSYCQSRKLSKKPSITATRTSSEGATGSEPTTTIMGTTMPRLTFTFITTDKNPSVVYSPGPTPNYSAAHDNPLPDPGVHKSALHSHGSHSQAEPATTASPKPSHAITAGRTYVVIDGKTYNHLSAGQTTTVTVDSDGGSGSGSGGGSDSGGGSGSESDDGSDDGSGSGSGSGPREVFTVNPTAVVGGGTTVTKPAPPQRPETRPTTSMVNGVHVSASGSVVDIGNGHKMTVPADGTTSVIDGQHVSIAPGMVIVGSSETMTWSVEPTHVLVAGGDLATFIGPTVVVIHSKTITYSSSSSSSSSANQGQTSSPSWTTTTIDDDTMTLGPEGVVVVHNSTFGGLTVEATRTEHEIVGGASVTQVGSTAVVVGGKTYPIGNDATADKPVTTSLGGQVLTIGSDGVKVGTMTLIRSDGQGEGGDDDDAVTTTIVPRSSSSSTSSDTSSEPTRTGSSISVVDDDGGAGIVYPNLLLTAVSVLSVLACYFLNGLT